MYYLNPGKIIRQLFPNQTKTILSTFIWSVIFLLDIALVFWLAQLAGIRLLAARQKTQIMLIGAYLAAAFGIFYLQSKLYDKIIAGLR